VWFGDGVAMEMVWGVRNESRAYDVSTELAARMLSVSERQNQRALNSVNK
jgi:hypothetical protein